MTSSRSSFTMIELLISTAIAMLIAGLVTTTFLEMRKTINRAEARLAMHARAQTLYHAMHRSFGALQQTCAIVGLSKQAGGSPEAGQVDLLFMRAKENRNDFWQDGASLCQTQLTWEEWRWLRSTSTLYSANSSIVAEDAGSRKRRRFTLGSSFTPAGSGFDYMGKTFINQAKPRRWLDPITPLATLDDNIWFPGAFAATPQNAPWSDLTPRIWFPSLAPTGSDEGDYSDLQSNITIELTDVTDFAVQLVLHDPAATVNVPTPVTGTSRPSPRAAGLVALDSTYDDRFVLEGAWLDGRLGQTLDPAGPVSAGASPPVGWNDLASSANFHNTVAAARPRLIRIAFTLSDPDSGLSQDFSFSFAPPALAPQQ